MHTNYISTAALRNAPRAEIVRLQAELADRTQEASTGRKADVGVALGTGTGRTVATRNDLTLVETLQISNGLATARLSQTQHALEGMHALATNMLNSLIALPAGEAGTEAITIEANSALRAFNDLVNGSDVGSYLFGGINTTTVPLAEFEDGPKAALDAAFLGKFGVPIGDPAAKDIAAADMTDFLANEFAAEFDLPGWTTNWSSASSEIIVSRISPSERVETSASANHAALRELAKGLTMVAALDSGSLDLPAREAIVDAARLTIGSALAGIVSMKSALGFSENAITRANDRMELSSDLMTEKIMSWEGADPVEAKTRIDLITTQIEMSYALTNQLARLSILNYA